MKTVMVNKLNDSFIGDSVRMKGWVYNTRSIGKIWFLIFRDGTGLIQGVVVKNEVSEKIFKLESELNQEDSIIIEGTIRKESRSIGGYEITIKEIKIVNHVINEYPISPKEHGADFLMSNRHLWIRSKRQNAIMRIRHQVSKSIRDFFDSNGFTLLDSPIFTANAVEGTTSLFEVDYFERSAFLSQSGQLYQEAGASAFGRSYCFGPCFRAEKSKTRRHLTEFWMVEPEMAYVDLDENMEWAESLVCYIISHVLSSCKVELKVLDRDISKLENIIPPFPKLSYKDAVDLLKDNGSSFKYGNDFGSPDEGLISSQFSKPVLIHRWPSNIKPFYMKRDRHDNSLALGVDMIAPEGFGEIIGGGQREEDLTILQKSISHHDLPLEPFKWFLDLRKYGSVPHSGFGLGLERMVAWICNLKHIRETIPFPRTMGRIEP
jgi:asparaginyl-tRNA synthetase